MPKLLSLFKHAGVIFLVAGTLPTASRASERTDNDRTGLYLRATLGVGGSVLYANNYYTKVAADGLRERHKVEADQGGASTSMELTIGGFFAPDVAVQVEFAGFILPAPRSRYSNSWTFNGNLDTTDNRLSTDVDGGLLSSSIRLGFTGYLMPAGVYIGTSVGPSWLSLGGGWQDVDTSVGISATFRIGKEWSLSEHWGLGVGLLVEYTDRRLRGDQTLVLAAEHDEGSLGKNETQLGVSWLGLTVSVSWN